MAFVLVLAGLAVLTVGAEVFIRGAAGFSLRLGISPLVVGLTVVAFGTSAPELAVGVKSALAGKGDIAVGNVFGSNIFNVAAILGLAALVSPVAVHRQVLVREMPIMLGATVLALAFFLPDRTISRPEAGVLAAGIFVYVIAAVRMALRESVASRAAVVEEIPADPGRPLPVLGLMVLAGATLLVAGAALMVNGASAIARSLGVSEAVIGVTIVAAGTSLPELATTVAAAARRHADLALGNIVGSNIFNLFSILGLSGLAAPLNAPDITVTDMAFMAGTSFALLPMMLGHRINRFEGAVLVTAFASYLLLVWPR
jgi:cation:H+ antiporter